MLNFKDATYASEEDKSLVEKAVDYNVWLMCGDNLEKQQQLKKIFIDKCEKVNVVENGVKHRILSTKSTLGYCSADEEQNYTVEVYGSKNSKNKLKTIHQIVHEFCHAMQHVASYILRDNSRDYVYDGKEYSVHGACILEKKLNVKPGESRYSTYGNFFCETITDLLTSIELFYKNDKYHKDNITADDILKSNYHVLENSNLQKNGYSIYLSLARLAISAFSNTGSISYDDIIKSGNSIILGKIKDRPVNDLLYGIMCDARYVEDQFDQFMGNNAYYKLCSKLDSMLNKKINPTEVKEIMTKLSIFHNRKKQYLLANGIIDMDEYMAMTTEFNLVFNNLQNEYNAFFTGGDISGIRNSFKK